MARNKKNTQKNLKLPHMGWNEVVIKKENDLIKEKEKSIIIILFIVIILNVNLKKMKLQQQTMV